jgi:hypothetical protein
MTRLGIEGSALLSAAYVDLLGDASIRAGP